MISMKSIAAVLLIALVSTRGTPFEEAQIDVQDNYINKYGLKDISADEIKTLFMGLNDIKQSPEAMDQLQEDLSSWETIMPVQKVDDKKDVVVAPVEEKKDVVVAVTEVKVNEEKTAEKKKADELKEFNERIDVTDFNEKLDTDLVKNFNKKIDSTLVADFNKKVDVTLVADFNKKVDNKLVNDFNKKVDVKLVDDFNKKVDNKLVIDFNKKVDDKLVADFNKKTEKKTVIVKKDSDSCSDSDDNKHRRYNRHHRHNRRHVRAHKNSSSDDVHIHRRGVRRHPISDYERFNGVHHRRYRKYSDSCSDETN